MTKRPRSKPKTMCRNYHPHHPLLKRLESHGPNKWIFAILYSHDNFDEPDCHVQADSVKKAYEFAEQSAKEYCRTHNLDHINLSVWPYGELEKGQQWTVYLNEAPQPH